MKKFQLQYFISRHSLHFDAKFDKYKVLLHPRSYEKIMIFFRVVSFVGVDAFLGGWVPPFLGADDSVTHP